MHTGFVPWDLVKRVASFQEQQCQLAGQGPVSKLGERERERLRPTPREHLCSRPGWLLPWGLLSAPVLGGTGARLGLV